MKSISKSASPCRGSAAAVIATQNQTSNPLCAEGAGVAVEVDEGAAHPLELLGQSVVDSDLSSTLSVSSGSAAVSLPGAMEGRD